MARSFGFDRRPASEREPGVRTLALATSSSAPPCTSGAPSRELCMHVRRLHRHLPTGTACETSCDSEGKPQLDSAQPSACWLRILPFLRRRPGRSGHASSAATSPRVSVSELCLTARYMCICRSCSRLAAPALHDMRAASACTRTPLPQLSSAQLSSSAPDSPVQWTP